MAAKKISLVLLFVPLLVVAVAAPLYLSLNNKGVLCHLLGCNGTNVLNQLFYPLLAMACLAGSFGLSREMGGYLRAAYLALVGVVAVGVCLVFPAHLIHWL